MKTKIKRDIVRRIDPETGKPYWSNEEVEVHKPEDHDRTEAVLDILRGTTTPEDVQKKYDIVSINSIYTWIGKKLRAHAYDMMINLAEETFNIPIRKKTGTKQ